MLAIMQEICNDLQTPMRCDHMSALQIPPRREADHDGSVRNGADCKTSEIINEIRGFCQKSHAIINLGICISAVESLPHRHPPPPLLPERLRRDVSPKRASRARRTAFAHMDRVVSFG
jgi:hypothetical protein